jgi:hypothetical protein
MVGVHVVEKYYSKVGSAVFTHLLHADCAATRLLQCKRNAPSRGELQQNALAFFIRPTVCTCQTCSPTAQTHNKPT